MNISHSPSLSCNLCPVYMIFMGMKKDWVNEHDKHSRKTLHFIHFTTITIVSPGSPTWSYFYTALKSFDLCHRVDIERQVFGKLFLFQCDWVRPGLTMTVNEELSKYNQGCIVSSPCTLSRDQQCLVSPSPNLNLAKHFSKQTCSVSKHEFKI